MPKYAAETKVTVASSKAEIERVLQRYGADQFYQGWIENCAAIGFRIEPRNIRMTLPLPSRDSEEFVKTETGRVRSDTSRAEAYEQACRQRWRALILVVKAKLEAIDCGISTIEREFLSDVVLSNGMTVHEWAEPQIREMYQSGKMPSLLPGVEQLRITA